MSEKFFLASGLLVIVSGVSGFAQYQKPPDFLCPEFGKIFHSHINNIFAPTAKYILLIIAGVYPCNCTAESDEGIAVECDNTNLGITVTS